MPTPRNSQPCTDDGSVEQKLTGCIRALLAAAGRLKSALVARDADAIWEALGEQEEQAGLLNAYSTLWQEMTDGADPSAPSRLDAERRRLRIEIKRLQALQRANSMLAQSFLSAVRKAIGSVSEQAASNSAGTYSKLGRRHTPSTPALVQRLG